MRILIGGLGDLGRRAAALWSAKGHQVIGVRRSKTPSKGAWQTLRADMAELEAGRFSDVDLALFCASPDAREPEAYRRCYVQAAGRFMASVPDDARRLLVTSTAVIEGADGEWVDERLHAPPQRWNGRLLAEAENTLRQRWPGLCVLRPSGLYGPGRDWLLRRVRAGEPGGGRYAHRIHIDDCARGVVHLADQPALADSYILSDDAPLAEWQVMRGLAAMLGLPTTGGGETSSGRRLSNRRLHDSGFVLRYPHFRLGYAALLATAG